MAKSVETFSASEAALISNVPYTSVDYWARTELVTPSIADANGSGTERRYDFKDLLALRAAKELRQQGVSTRALCMAVEYVRGVKDALSEYRFLAIGKTITWVKANEIIKVAKNPKQGAFAFTLLNYPAMVREVSSAAKVRKQEVINEATQAR